MDITRERLYMCGFCGYEKCISRFAMTDESIISDIKRLAEKELRHTAQIIELLAEVEKRKLFLTMGYPHLYEFCRSELKYSEGSAHRRISAMRLLKELPEVKSKIESGDLSLSNASQAQVFFNRQDLKDNPMSREEKLELLKDIENTSTRECERELLKRDPSPIYFDRERSITEDLTELRITVDGDFMKLISQAKDAYSHAMPQATTKDILELALAQLVKKKTPNAVPTPAPEAPAENKRRPSKALEAAVREACEHRCCYVDKKSGRRCSATRFTEIDHIIPFSKGGQTEFSNLQLLCWAHNHDKSDRLKY